MGSLCGSGLGTWDFPRAPRHSQSGHLESLAHPLLAFADGTEPEWKLDLPQTPATDSYMDDESPLGPSLYLPPSQSIWCGQGRPWPAHSPQHHPGAGQATVPVVELLDAGHRQLHKVPCMETQLGHRPLAQCLSLPPPLEPPSLAPAQILQVLFRSQPTAFQDPKSILITTAVIFLKHQSEQISPTKNPPVGWLLCLLGQCFNGCCPSTLCLLASPLLIFTRPPSRQNFHLL